MSSTLLTPESELFPNRFRWTVEDCYRLMDAGFLEGRYELIDGEIISRTGQKPPHGLTLMIIREWLAMLFGERFIREEKPISIPGDEGTHTEPEPDLAVTTRPATSYGNRHPGPGDLLLAVEVSDTTLRFDLHMKALIYARSGVREYWVVDIVNRRIHTHLKPTATGYTDVSVHNEDAIVTLSSRPDNGVIVSSLLPPRNQQSA